MSWINLTTYTVLNKKFAVLHVHFPVDEIEDKELVKDIEKFEKIENKIVDVLSKYSAEIWGKAEEYGEVIDVESGGKVIAVKNGKATVIYSEEIAKLQKEKAEKLKPLEEEMEKLEKKIIPKLLEIMKEKLLSENK